MTNKTKQTSGKRDSPQFVLWRHENNTNKMPMNQAVTVNIALSYPQA